MALLGQQISVLAKRIRACEMSEHFRVIFQLLSLTIMCVAVSHRRKLAEVVARLRANDAQDIGQVGQLFE